MLGLNGAHHPLTLDLKDIEGRSRSDTWPGHDVVIKREQSESPVPNPMMQVAGCKLGEPQKKMRNAWGNMSYADLITQAILSSPDKRLTLAEIYEWIVQNVPYFADKAASPSTAGWKVRKRLP